MEIVQIFQEVKLINQYFKQKYCKFQRDAGFFLQNTLSEIWTNSKWSEERLEKASHIQGGLK